MRRKRLQNHYNKFLKPVCLQPKAICLQPKAVCLTLVLVCLTLIFSSCHGKKTSSASSDTGILVVATNSWSAAYALAAGAEKVETIAPFEMVHPSEYELRPGDIPKLKDAGLIVYAGYEYVTARLKKGLDIPPEKLLQIETGYNYESMEKSILKIAVMLGTENIARENLLEIRRIMDEARKTVEDKGMSGQPVVVHRMQTSLVRELGLTPVLVYGPASPEASEFVAVSKSEAPLIIDNMHNPVGQPFKDILPGARYIQWMNFPGQKGTKTITDVIRYNVSLIN